MSESTIEAPQKPRPKPQLIFSDKSSVTDTYESYAKEGFAHLISNQAEFPHDQKNQFLSRVDLSKGPILVAVQNIIRTMAVDWDSPKRERKEYMYYTTQWEAKNHKNNTIRYILENEGRHTQQTKEIVTKTNAKGQGVDVYVKSRASEV